MFNIGPLELMVVLVLALIVFGPAKLPELMASAGNMIREFQRASRELTDVFQETQQEFTSAFQETQQEFTSAFQETQQEFTSAFDLSTPNGVATSPVASTTFASDEPATADDDVPVAGPVPVDVAAEPDELETAAAMLDPVEPFPIPTPAVPDQPIAVVAAPSDQAWPEPASADLPTNWSEAVVDPDVTAASPGSEHVGYPSPDSPSRAAESAAPAAGVAASQLGSATDSPAHLGEASRVEAAAGMSNERRV